MKRNAIAQSELGCELPREPMPNSQDRLWLKALGYSVQVRTVTCTAQRHPRRHPLVKASPQEARSLMGNVPVLDVGEPSILPGRVKRFDNEQLRRRIALQ